MIIRDDMVFEEYPKRYGGGYQCIMNLKSGKMSVRFGSHQLFCRKNTYEARLPGGDVVGNMTADDIWNFIKEQSR